MRKRFKIVLNLDIENPDDPFPAAGDYTNMTRFQGIVYTITAYSQFHWKDHVRYSVTLDKVIDKGEIE
jgi:hypothetical protein